MTEPQTTETNTAAAPATAASATDTPTLASTPTAPAAGVQFADLRLDPKVLQAVTDAGYTTPTPIQAGAIPPALEGRDVLGIAQTGTGKTASFTLPMITLLGRGRAKARMPRSLVLCPTRELAAQVAENFEAYAKHTRLTKALLIGGVSMRDQELLIQRGVDVLIATPGRLLDHFERGNLLLQGVQIMVVDEADRMLDMGFIPDIERIFQLTPFTRQTLFFSATMAPEIERITDTFLHAPARIEVARQATASETITQRLVEITPTRKDQSARHKRELLRALIDAEGPALKNAIIFCNRKTEVDVVAKSLKAHGYDAAPIHGDLDQSQRTRTLEGFREGTLRFLIASDVAARGLDIPAVSHVFNFDLPSHAEDYVHRIGRTGRAGREGTAISLAVPSDEKYLTAIENLLKRSLPRLSVPEGFTMGEGRDEPARPSRDAGRESSRDAGREGGRNGRSRSRSRSRPGATQVDTDVRADAAPAEARPDPRPEPGPEAVRTDARREERSPRREGGRQDEGRNDDRRRDNARQDSSHQDASRHDTARHEEPRRDDSRRGDARRGPAVVGLGDHVPDFLTRSFRTALSRLAETDAGADAGTGTEAGPAAGTRAEPVRQAAPASGRSRNRNAPRRGERSPEPPVEAPSEAATATAEAAPVPEAATPATVLPEATATPEAAPRAEAPAPDAPAMPETPATPEPAPQAAAAEADPAAEIAAPAPRARRSRKPAAAAAPEAAADPAAEATPAAKPTRARRTRSAAATPAAAAETPAAAPASRSRSRRKSPAPEAEGQPGASEAAPARATPDDAAGAESGSDRDA